jgi:hypothetical protein
MRRTAGRVPVVIVASIELEVPDRLAVHPFLTLRKHRSSFDLLSL